MQAVLPTKGQSSSWIETAWQLAIKCSQLTFSLFSQDRGFAGKQISVSFVIITDVSNISPSAVFSSSEKALLFSDASWSWIEARITLVWISSTQKLRLFTHYDENILCASYSATIIRTNHHHHFHHDGLGEGLVGQQFPGPHSPLVKNHSLSSIFLTTGRDDLAGNVVCLNTALRSLQQQVDQRAWPQEYFFLKWLGPSENYSWSLSFFYIWKKSRILM